MARKIRDARECPRDWTPLNKELRHSFLRKTQVDVCPKCAGLFLDKDEVEALTGSHALHELLTKYQGLDASSQLVCPNCGGLMEIMDAWDVRVDACLDCKGVWLDAGELERLKATDRAEFKHLTQQEMDEYMKAKELRREQHLNAIRSLFGGLGRP